MEDQQICVLGEQNQQKRWSNTWLLGAGEFLTEQEATNYGFPKPDHQQTPVAAEAMDLNFGVQLRWSGEGEADVPDLFTKAVCAWSELLRNAGTAA